MQKVFIGAAIIVAIGGYVWWSMSSTAPSGTTSAPSESINPNSGTTTPVAGGSTNPPAPTTTPATSKYKNGIFTGPVVDSIFGPVQAKITISGGKIVTVSVPVYPNSPGHTTEVSASTIPLLKQEVIAAQSADIDMISGATQTVEAFQISLRAALSLAS